MHFLVKHKINTKHGSEHKKISILSIFSQSKINIINQSVNRKQLFSRSSPEDIEVQVCTKFTYE